MNHVALKDIPEWVLEFSLARYRNELSQAIHDLMTRHRLKRVQLAALLGVDKSRITQMLSGEENLGADTLVQVLLVLGRAPHLLMASDIMAVRRAEDESEESTGTTDSNVQVLQVLDTSKDRKIGHSHGKETKEGRNTSINTAVSSPFGYSSFPTDPYLRRPPGTPDVPVRRLEDRPKDRRHRGIAVFSSSP